MSLTIRYVAVALVATTCNLGFTVAQEHNVQSEFDPAVVTVGTMQESSTGASLFSETLADFSAGDVIPASLTSSGHCSCGLCNDCVTKLKKCKGAVITPYGFGQADYIQDFNRVNPAYESTLRPTRIPTTEGQFGSDGNAIISPRQSRLGVNGLIPTQGGPIKTKFEFDMFGVGVDEGQTTFRLRHAYGEYGNFLAGQTNSVFMDGDAFPNVIDYWGPSGMIFLRTPQIRWQPVQGRHNFALSLEHPDSGIDVGQFDRAIQDLGVDVRAVERFVDVASHYRMTLESGTYAQVAGILRPIGFETIGTPGNNPQEDFLGWGVNLSSNIFVGDRGDRIISSYVFGEGIANYFNDGGVDLAPQNPVAPANVAPQPIQGLVLYYDHYWNDLFSSAIGYSQTNSDTFAGQASTAFRRGEYISTNLLYTPVENVMVGVEYLWGSREDLDGARGEDNRIQTSFKYSF